MSGKDNSPVISVNSRMDSKRPSADTKSVKSVNSVKSLPPPRTTSADNKSVRSLTLAETDKRSVKSLQLDNRSIRSFHSTKSDTKSHKQEDAKSILSSPALTENGFSSNDDEKEGFKRGRRTRKDKNLIAMISLGYRYIYKTQKLQVDIKRCWDIVPKGRGWERVDPYVKVYLMPEKSRAGKRKSQILRNTFDPVFEKKLEYDIQKAELENRSLYISLWHNNLFGHNIFLGELNIPLDSQLSQVRPQTYELRKKPNLFGDDSDDDDEDEDDSETGSVMPTIVVQDETTENADETDNAEDQRRASGTTSLKSVSTVKSQSKRAHNKFINPFMAAVAYCGDVLLAIKFVPENSVVVVYDRDLESRGEVFICIKKGMNLTGFGAKGETNAYCKLQMVHEGTIVFKHKTNVVKDDSNPEWNACRRFENVGEEDLRDADIELVVLNKIGIGTKMIGKSKITITGQKYDWTRAKFLSDNTLYLDELVHHANNWIEFMAPLKPHDDNDVRPSHIS